MSASAADWLAEAAERVPDRVAVAETGRWVTYAELDDEADRLAAELAEEGVEPGDPVAIDLPAGIDHAIALHAGIRAGAVVQSMPAAGREGVSVAPGARFVDAGSVQRAAAASRRVSSPGSGGQAQRDADDPLTRVLSSGTSGEPKPIELTLGNHLASARASAERLGVEPDDRWLCCLPLNHVGGLTILLRSVTYGTAAVIENGFHTDSVAALIEAGEATIASLVPTQLVRLLEAGAPVERPRLLLVGGGPLPSDVLEESLGRGATVVQTYGLTEACSQVCTLAPEEARERAGSAGRPLPRTEVRIGGEEILVRGPTVAPGAISADGWLHTGDLGRIDDDGYLWVEGRRDDLIVTGGENVRPERVEAALSAHPSIADAAVVGRDDREWGQVVIGFVVPVGGAEVDPGVVREQLRSELSRHEVPKEIRVVESLPRTASGKLQRRLLRTKPPDESHT